MFKTRLNKALCVSVCLNLNVGGAAGEKREPATNRLLHKRSIFNWGVTTNTRPFAHRSKENQEERYRLEKQGHDPSQTSSAVFLFPPQFQRYNRK